MVRRHSGVILFCLGFLIGNFDALAISLGDRIQANSTVNVRQTAAGTVLGTQSSGSLGVTIGGPTIATLNGTQYTWWNINFDTGVDGWVATVGFNAVTPATPTSPSPGTTSSPGPVQASSTVTLSWGASSGATYYDVGVVDVATGTMVASGYPTTTSFTATLTAGKTYRWNVAAGDSAGESSFTTVLYFQTPGTKPPTPTSPSPGTTSSPGPVQASSTVTLSWGASSGATYYDYGVVDVATGTMVASGYPTTTSVTITLTAGKTYRWNVAADNASGESGFTTVLYFQTPAQPDVPSNPYPADGSVLTVQPTTLDWADSANATSYDVYLKLGNGSFSKVGADLSTSQWSPNVCYDATSFSWYVVAKNAAGSTQGPTWSFTIGTTPGSFHIGARVMAASGGANVRDAQLDSTALFLQYGGVHGTIVGGPTSGTAGGFTGNWWQINWDSEPPNQNGNNGWSAESVISLAPFAGDISQPSFSSSYYTANNIFWQSGFAPASTAPSNPQLGIALGNCTWYAWGRMLELGYSVTQLNALHGNASNWFSEAQASGIPVDSTPTVHSIAQSVSIDHVAVVESVNADGTITVTESSYVTNSASVWNFLWHHRTCATNWFSNYIHVSLGSGLGVNPSTSDIAAQIQTFAQQYQIPASIIASVAWKESNWKQFDSNGNPLTGPTGDIGIMQINVTSPALSFDTQEVRTNWVYNMQVACQILTNKFKLSGIDTPSPYDSAYDTYQSILENWYYPVAWYNGSGSDAYSYVTTVWSYLKSQPSPLNSYFISIPTLGDPTTLSSFPTTIYTSVPYPPGSLNLATATPSQLVSHGMYTLLILAQNGQRIHQWNWTTSNASDITSIFTGGGGGSAPIISNPQISGSTFTLVVPTQTGTNYVLEYKNTMSDLTWIPIQTNSGNGAQMVLTNTGATGPSRFYRIRLQ